ncbi:BTB/POZ domain-containing protein 6-B-like [Amblyomma americanum]
MILALQNDVFRAMFYGDFAKEERVIITDLHPEGVLGLLRYFYSGHLEVEGVHQALCTRSAAVKYLVPELAEKCIAYVKRNMKPEDVCPVLDYAITMGEDHSDLPVKDILLSDSISVLSSEAFACCSEYTADYVVDHVVDVPEICLSSPPQVGTGAVASHSRCRRRRARAPNTHAAVLHQTSLPRADCGGVRFWTEPVGNPERPRGSRSLQQLTEKWFAAFARWLQQRRLSPSEGEDLP